MDTDLALSVVGGVYEERCMRPDWYEVYGSAGRACSAIAAFEAGLKVTLHCYADARIQEALAARSALERTELVVTTVPSTIRFVYVHGLDRPHIERAIPAQPPIHVRASHILRFGMLEGDAVVEGTRVVYDPQNATDPVVFHANGSVAGRLAVVLNETESRLMTGLNDAGADKLIEAVRKANGADVVVLKRGPLGCLVLDGSVCTHVPALRTQTVWKIGSGDVFSAHFALNWAVQGRGALESAQAAGRATATYCQTGGFPDAIAVQTMDAPSVVPSAGFLAGRAPKVYLAGPFFSLAQLWMVEQARSQLLQFGVGVFSPYHDVGVGSADRVVEADLQGLRDADLLFAIGDGLDAGTLVEIGYAVARGTPVVIYCENENEEDLKMMVGSKCVVCSDFVSAIYATLWVALSL